MLLLGSSLLPNVCVAQELAVGLEGRELGLGNVQPPLQQIALRGNCLLEH